MMIPKHLIPLKPGYAPGDLANTLLPKPVYAPDDLAHTVKPGPLKPELLARAEPVEPLDANSAGCEEKVASVLIETRDAFQTRLQLGLDRSDYEEIVARPTFAQIYQEKILAYAFLPALPEVAAALVEKCKSGSTTALRTFLEVVKLLKSGDEHNIFLEQGSDNVKLAQLRLLRYGGDTGLTIKNLLDFGIPLGMDDEEAVDGAPEATQDSNDAEGAGAATRAS
jgi:hypothetical protein